MHAGQTLWLLSLAPIRPDVGAYHAAFGANRSPVQVEEHGVIWPLVGVNDRAVVAIEPLSTVDQQSPDAMRADMAEGDRRPLVRLASPFGCVGRRAGHGDALGGPIVPSDGILNNLSSRFPSKRNVGRVAFPQPYRAQTRVSG